MRRSGELGDFERLCVQQAAIVVALELMRERVARETERRLSGEVLAATLSGRLAADDVRDRLAPFGIGERAVVLAFELGDAAAAEPTLAEFLAAEPARRWSPPHAAGRRELLCARGRRRQGRSPRARGAGPRGARGRARPDPRRGQPPARRRSACATPSTRRAARSRRPRFANGAAPEVASYRDLGAFTLLLSVQDTEALRLYCESVLGPIEDSDERYAGELLRSLEAYIDRNGHWERAASDCYCHRHTLRYRIKRIEELTGRDLSRANDRVELWLALRAKELIA